MKFGLLDFNCTVNWYWDNSWNNKALLNVGDAAEYLVIEQLYKEIGISEDKWVRLSIKDLTTYSGEKLIVALNIALDSYVGYNDILENLSPDITPVFLGMSFADTNMNTKQLDCLRRFQPIGCRDERSYCYMQKMGIECYLNGCTASLITLPDDNRNTDDGKILFIDVPAAVVPYIPEEIKGQIKFVNQELYCRRSDLSESFSPREWANAVMSNYSANVKFIVTSRFHGAVLALANNIPAIITLEKYTFRFSWIKNYLPIYTEENFSQIMWDISEVHYEPTKKLMKTIAKKRITDVITRCADYLEITDFQRTYEKSETQSSNQVLYYHDALERIRTTWNKQDTISYSFWGINDNSVYLNDYIKREYPNARLVAVYDMFKEIEFDGVKSEHPSCLIKKVNTPDFYVIVSAYLAARVAMDIAESIGFPMKNFIMCERKFVSANDLLKGGN